MRLNAVTANCHLFDGNVNGKPIRIRIEFDGGKALRLQVAGDGHRMVIDNELLDEPFEMGKFGRLDSADVSEEILPLLGDRDVASLNAMELDGQQVGLRLRTLADDFYFWADGDELFWGDRAALSSHDWLDEKKPEATERFVI